MQIQSSASHYKTNNHSYSTYKENHQEKQSNKQNRSDSVSISMASNQLFSQAGNTKKNSMLQSLMEQKQKLIENKNEFLQNANENGTSMDRIKERMKEFEEQLATLEEQITEQMLEDRKQNMNMDAKDSKGTNSLYEAPKSEEELQKDNLEQLFSLASTTSQLSQLASSQTKAEGQKRIVLSEIKQDDGYITNFKKEKLASLNESINNISDKFSEMIDKTTKQVADSIDNSKEKTDDETKSQHDFHQKMDAYKQAQNLLSTDLPTSTISQSA